MYISDLTYVYVRVQGVIWILNGLTESTNVRNNVGNEIDKIYNTESTKLPLIIDFRNIESIADHALDLLFKSIESRGRSVIFLNTNLVESSLYPNIPESLNAARFSESSSRSLNISIGGSYSSTEFLPVINEMITKKIASIVKDSFRQFESPMQLSSTPIVANGIFDANDIISDSESFLYTCLSLNDILQRVISETGKPKFPIKLLSVSLRSSPFASVLSQLNKIPLETIDHLGPRHKVFDLDILSNLLDKKRYSYIYVGDFCFGGTEIKIAKTYAQFAQSNFESAIVIGSLFPPDTFKEDFKLNPILDLKEISNSIGAVFKFT